MIPRNHVRIVAIVPERAPGSLYALPTGRSLFVRTRVRGHEKSAIVDYKGRVHMMVDQGRTWAVGWTSEAAAALETIYRLSNS